MVSHSCIRMIVDGIGSSLLGWVEAHTFRSCTVTTMPGPTMRLPPMGVLHIGDAMTGFRDSSLSLYLDRNSGYAADFDLW